MGNPRGKLSSVVNLRRLVRERAVRVWDAPDPPAGWRRFVRQQVDARRGHERFELLDAAGAVIATEQWHIEGVRRGYQCVFDVGGVEHRLRKQKSTGSPLWLIESPTSWQASLAFSPYDLTLWEEPYAQFTIRQTGTRMRNTVLALESPAGELAIRMYWTAARHRFTRPSLYETGEAHVCPSGLPNHELVLVAAFIAFESRTNSLVAVDAGPSGGP
jgi:hypothetical protein